MQTLGMLLAKGWFQKVTDFVLGFFAFIPQIIYFLYSSIASLLDLLQYLVRKLAGLDGYYVNGVAQEGDIVTDFLKGIVGIDKSPAYSSIATVFWSLVIFGVILLVLSTIVSIIKAHYNYDANKSHPMTILRGALKSVATMAIVPIVAIFGVYLTQILLRSLDEITSPTTSSALAGIYEANAVNKFASDDDGTYTSYDYFSAGGYTKTSTFSGMLFKVSAYGCNRVRTGYFTATINENEKGTWDNMGVFYASSGSANQHEVIAAQIDYAFANNLKLKETYSKVEIENTSEANALGPSLRFGYSATLQAGLYNVKSFSKYNIGLVFYYYNLWSFNAIIGFAGACITAVMLGNIIFGLMARLLQVVALFIVYPAFIGIMPLDDGNGFTQWRKQFTSDILMAFGAVVGMNIFFLILPFFNTISFFNEAFLDGIVNMIIVIAGLTLVKKFIKLVSGFIGASDANEVGQSTRQDVTASAIKGVVGTLGAGALGVTAAKPIVSGAKAGGKAAAKGAKKAGGKIANKIANTKAGKLMAQKAAASKQARDDRKYNRMVGKKGNAAVSDEERKAFAQLMKLDNKERRAIIKMAGVNDRTAGSANFNRTLRNELGLKGTDKSKKKFEQHTQNTFNRKQKATDRKFKLAKNIGSILGQDTSKYKAGSVSMDDQGNITQTKGTGVFKGVGQALLDISKSTVKTVGELTGASAAWKKLGDSGAVDKAKENLATLFGINPSGDFAKATGLQTKKSKDDAEKADLKNLREAQLKEQQAIAKNTEDTKKAIEELAKKLTSSSNKKI